MPRPASPVDRRMRLRALVVVVVLVLLALPEPSRAWDVLGLHYPAYVKYFLLQCGTAVLLLAWLWSHLTRRRPGAPFGALARRYLPEALFGALVALSLLSATWSDLPYISVLGAVMILVRVGWGLLAATVDWRRRHFSLLVGSLLGAGALAAVSTLALGALGDEQYLVAVFGHRNFLSCFLIPSVCLAAAVALRGGLPGGAAAGPRRRLLARAGALVLAASMLAVIVLSDAYGALVGLAAGGAVFRLAFLPPAKRRRYVQAAAAAGLVAAIVLVAAWPRLRPRFLLTAQSTRYFHAVGAVRMILARPLLGWGVGTYLSRFPQFRPVEAGRYGRMNQISIHPHNEYAAAAIRTGLLGLALFLGGLVVVARRAWRALPGSPERLWRAALLAGWVGMLVHALFTVSLGFWGAAPMFWTLTGALMALGRPGDPAPHAARRPTAGDVAAFGACAVLVAVAWWQFAWQGVSAERRFLQARRAAPSEAVPLYQKTLSGTRYVPDYILAHAGLGAALKKAGRPAESALTYDRMRILAPDLGQLDLELGAAYERLAASASPGVAAGLRERAAAFYNAAVTVRPYYRAGLPHKRLGEALVRLSPRYLPRAITQMRRAILVAPRNPSFHYLLGRYLHRAGRPAEALAAYDRSAALRRGRLARQVGSAALLSAAGVLPSAARRLAAAGWTARALAGTQYLAAQALADLDERSAAVQRLDAALALWPEYAEAARLRASLATPGAGN